MGYFVIALASACFGLLALIENDTLFFVLALVLRFVQGLADAFITVAIYSVVTLEFPGKREEYIGYCEGAIGIGLMVGPVMGSFLFGAMGYEYTFLTISGILFVFTVIVCFMLPGRLNNAKDNNVTASENEALPD
jgi:MFS family permease